MATLDIAMIHSNQDADESAGTVTVTGANLNCNGTAQYIGLIFHHTDMANLVGATINSMVVRMNFPSGSFDDADVIWKMCWNFLWADALWLGDASEISTSYTNGTTATVAWNVSSVGTGSEDSPDLKTLFQELQGDGWGISNDSMYKVMVLVKGNSAGSAMRITAYDGTPANSARLIVDYTPAGKAIFPFYRPRRARTYLRL